MALTKSKPLPSIEPSIPSRIAGGLAGFFGGFVVGSVFLLKPMWQWDGKFDKYDDDSWSALTKGVIWKVIGTPFALVFGAVFGAMIGTADGLMGGVGKLPKVFKGWVASDENRKELSGPLANRDMDLAYAAKYMQKAGKLAKDLDMSQCENSASTYGSAWKALAKANYHLQQAEAHVTEYKTSSLHGYKLPKAEHLPEGSSADTITQQATNNPKSLINTWKEKINNLNKQLSVHAPVQPTFFQRIKALLSTPAPELAPVEAVRPSYQNVR